MKRPGTVPSGFYVNGAWPRCPVAMSLYSVLVLCKVEQDTDERNV